MRKTLLALAVSLALAGCGGSDDGTPAGGGAGDAGAGSGIGGGGTGDGGAGGEGSGSGGGEGGGATATGVFVDAPVAGIRYTRSGGESGVTDADGRFSYTPGETVTFSIGNIQLPPVTLPETAGEEPTPVTPLMLFGTTDITAPAVVNFARLLQTLDDDGDPSTGLTIPASAHDLATQPIDFDVDVDDFAASAEVTNLLSAVGPTATLVPASQAIEHMQSELSRRGLSLTGSWYVSDEENDELIVVTFFRNGTYMIAEGSESDGEGWAGVEFGTYTWNPATGEFHAQAQKDTNGNYGLNEELGNLPGRDYATHVVVDGDELLFTELAEEGSTETETTALKRVKATADNALVGTWTHLHDPVTPNPGEIRAFTLTFLPDGQFMLAEVADPDDSGEAGIEHGTFEWDASGHNFAVTRLVRDTNGEWGLSHSGIQLAAVEGDQLTVTLEGEDPVVFVRLD